MPATLISDNRCRTSNAPSLHENELNAYILAGIERPIIYLYMMDMLHDMVKKWRELENATHGFFFFDKRQI